MYLEENYPINKLCSGLYTIKSDRKAHTSNNSTNALLHLDKTSCGL